MLADYDVTITKNYTNAKSTNNDIMKTSIGRHKTCIVVLAVNLQCYCVSQSINSLCDIRC